MESKWANINVCDVVNVAVYAAAEARESVWAVSYSSVIPSRTVNFLEDIKDEHSSLRCECRIESPLLTSYYTQFIICYAA